MAEPAYFWDAAALRFRSAATGRFVAPETVRGAVDAVASAAADQLEALTRRLLAGETDLGSWEAEARRIVKDAHLATATVAVGGRKRLTQSDLGRVGSRLRDEYAYLREFARAIDRGELTEGQITARIRMYGEGATTQYETARRQRHIDAGYREEIRILGSLIPCAECSEYAAMGWQPAGSLPRTGDECSCVSNCKCSFRFRKRRLESPS